MLFRDSETFYQCQKFNAGTDHTIEWCSLIRACNTPNKAALLARQKLTGRWSSKWYVNKTDKRLLGTLIDQYKPLVQPRQDWKTYRLTAMKLAVRAKFDSHPLLRQ
jgi:predicted NAD-dependent protein-ADP-ribosyltransferase YbiA (DUF1768 family)